MTSEGIVARIIGGNSTLADVEHAFSGRHSDLQYSRYNWVAQATLKGEDIIVTGVVYEDATEIGFFRRRLVYQKRRSQAVHEIMVIDRPHRDRDIAKHHYKRVLSFYERVGIERVTLEAEGEGPAVWPTFGFDLTARKHREMLVKVLRQWQVSPIPDSDSIFAPKVVAISTDDEPNLGQDALYELADRAAEPLPMALELRNPAQRTYLQNRGILPLDA